MRIGFLGKGGSGKTTIAAAFARWLAGQGKRVLVFDGDLNAHLQQPLGIERTPPALGGVYEEITSYVRGDRTDLGERPILSTTPPSRFSRFITTNIDDPFLSRYAVHKGTLSFLRVGSFESEDVGANCYHTKLHSMCVVLNHLKDTDSDWVIVDATAGIDTLSTSLVASYDLNIFIVEPTLKSVKVCYDYIKTDPSSAGRTVILANKVAAPTEEIQFIHEHAPAVPIIGSIHASSSLRAFEQGDGAAFDHFIAECRPTWEHIAAYCAVRRRTWGEFQQSLHEIHRKNCEWWYNSFYGMELHTGLDQPVLGD
jgi:CO dehydrogenase maturation factor